MGDYGRIGLIGGMGPESTALFYKYIIRSFQTHFGAVEDADFPEMLIHNLPIPDILHGVDQEANVQKMVGRSVRLMEGFGADFIAFPCNSLDYFVEYMRALTSVPIHSIVESTCTDLRGRGVRSALLLSTGTTYAQGLYQRRLPGIEIRAPPNKAEIADLIRETLAGSHPRERFLEMLKNGFGPQEAIIIGCTDLSILAEDVHDRRLVDSLVCLADDVMSACAPQYLSLKR